MKPKKPRLRLHLDAASLTIGLIGGALLVASAKAVSEMPADQQAALLAALTAALGPKRPTEAQQQLGNTEKKDPPR